MTRGLLMALTSLLLFSQSQALHAAKCIGPWVELKVFESRHLQGDGRIVDFSTYEQITTSEGQSYAMFFALVNNDRTRFKQLLEWTERNLAMGGLSQSLPAWKWGRLRGNQFGMVDANSASDSDLWMAYSLIEAARLWKIPEYKEKGLALMQLIKAQESAVLPGFGPMVLPGSMGFNPSPDVYRMNPSYLPAFLMQRLSEVSDDEFWRMQTDLSARLVIEASPNGYVPDWVTVTPEGIIPDIEKGRTGSYDAIRTYMWIAMTSREDPNRSRLMQSVYAYMQLANRLGEPLESVDTQTGIWDGSASSGFHYALEPLATELKLTRLLAAIHIRQKEVKSQDFSQFAYYDWVLFLYAKGWMDGRYRFEKNGALQVFWNQVC